MTTTTPTITVPDIPPQAFIATRYETETGQLYLDLDARDGSWSWGEDMPSGMTPADVWHGRVWRFRPPGDAKTEAVVDVIRANLPQLQGILDRYSIVWNGQNHVGRYGGGVMDTGLTFDNETLSVIHQRFLDIDDMYTVLTPDDWLGDDWAPSPEDQGMSAADVRAELGMGPYEDHVLYGGEPALLAEIEARLKAARLDAVEAFEQAFEQELMSALVPEAMAGLACVSAPPWLREAVTTAYAETMATTCDACWSVGKAIHINRLLTRLNAEASVLPGSGEDRRMDKIEGAVSVLFRDAAETFPSFDRAVEEIEGHDLADDVERMWTMPTGGPAADVTRYLVQALEERAAAAREARLDRRAQGV